VISCAISFLELNFLPRYENSLHVLQQRVKGIMMRTSICPGEHAPTHSRRQLNRARQAHAHCRRVLHTTLHRCTPVRPCSVSDHHALLLLCDPRSHASLLARVLARLVTRALALPPSLRPSRRTPAPAPTAARGRSPGGPWASSSWAATPDQSPEDSTCSAPAQVTPAACLSHCTAQHTPVRGTPARGSSTAAAAIRPHFPARMRRSPACGAHRGAPARALPARAHRGPASGSVPCGGSRAGHTLRSPILATLLFLARCLACARRAREATNFHSTVRGSPCPSLWTQGLMGPRRRAATRRRERQTPLRRCKRVRICPPPAPAPRCARRLRALCSDGAPVVPAWHHRLCAQAPRRPAQPRR